MGDPGHVAGSPMNEWAVPLDAVFTVGLMVCVEGPRRPGVLCFRPDRKASHE
jgi:hypothetical protein